MKVGPKSSLRPFLHRALQLQFVNDDLEHKQDFLGTSHYVWPGRFFICLKNLFPNLVLRLFSVQITVEKLTYACEIF